jgi:subtilisin family serine protease
MLHAKSLGWLLGATVAAMGCSAAHPTLGEDIQSSSGALSSSGSYIVLYKALDVPHGAARDVTNAGGQFVAAYPEIGVVIATSDDPGFVAAMEARPGVDSVGVTTGVVSSSALPMKHPNRKLPRGNFHPSGSGEPFAPMQWDMDQIHAPVARMIEPGKHSVVVGVLDSGVDDTMPDLQGRVDHSRSTTCIGGVSNPDPSLWSQDIIGHGSHVAGIIGAAINGKGIAGIAPNATLASVKVTDDGFIYPEALICAVMFGVAHGFDVMNASLFTDPWYYTCPSDHDQRVILIAEQRAVTYAKNHGSTMFAAASNENQDLANITQDLFSPTNGATIERTVDNTCKLLPAMLDGVVNVSAVGGDRNLAYYSNYGQGQIDVTAPGGDLHLQLPNDPSGQIVSDLPAYSWTYQDAINWNGRLGVDCADGLDPNDPNSDPTTCKETYALLQGTSMAAPHASGIAALILSHFGKMSSQELVNRIRQSATPLACPSGTYQPYPDDMPPETCTGRGFNNAFYGSGEVDALNAVLGFRATR